MASEEESDAREGAPVPARVAPAKGVVHAFIAEFRERAAGVSGAMLPAEVDRLLERIARSNIPIIPGALRAALDEAFQEMIETDREVGAMMRARVDSAERRHHS